MGAPQNDKDGSLPATVLWKKGRRCDSRRGLSYLVPSLVLAAVLAGGCSKAHTASVLGDAAHPTPVHFYTVAEETARRRIQAVGSLYAFEESTLSSQVEGRVAEVLADVGDNVKAGQALITLDPQELQFEVDRQRGLVTQVRAQLGIGPNDPPPTDPKKIASVQRAEADLFDADHKYSRAQQMYKDNLISQQQLDEAASRFQSTKATYTVALQEVDRLKALLISSEASERLAEKKLNDSTIRAPFPGAIKTRNVHPGEYVKVQSPVMVLVRTDRLRARLAVPERWAGWVRDGVYKVFLLNGNRVSERQIRPAGQTEDEHGRRFEVAEGLKPGDKVAVAISGDLREGSIVREQPEGTAPAAK